MGGGGPLAEVRGSRLEGRILPFLSHPRLLPSSIPCVVSVLLPGLPYSLELSTQEGQPSPSWGATRDEGLWVALEGGSWFSEESHGWRRQPSAQALYRGWRRVGDGAGTWASGIRQQV